MSNFFAGLDIAESPDFTALCVLDVPDYSDNEPELHIRWIERFEPKQFKGDFYPAMRTKVTQRLLRPPIWHQCELIVDATGVGKPVAQEFARINMPMKGVVFHGGYNETTSTDHRGRDWYHVPKMTLAAALRIPYGQGRVHVAKNVDPRMKEILADEMRDFRWKQNPGTGHETVEHREGKHDDILISIMLACWAAQRFGSAPVDESLSQFSGSYQDPSREFGSFSGDTDRIERMYGGW